DPRQRPGLRVRGAVAPGIPPSRGCGDARQRADPGRIPARGAGRMMDFDLLPKLPLAFSQATLFGALVIAGLAAGEALRRYAAMAAARGTATSPAVVMLVVHDLRAQGQVTERLLLFTAVNSVFAYVLLTLLLPFLHLEHQASWLQAVLHPLYLLWGSLVAGWL